MLSSEHHALEDDEGWLAGIQEVSEVLQGACDGKNQVSSGKKCVLLIHILDLMLTIVRTRRKISGTKPRVGNAKRYVTSSLSQVALC